MVNIPSLSEQAKQKDLLKSSIVSEMVPFRQNGDFQKLQVLFRHSISSNEVLLFKILRSLKYKPKQKTIEESSYKFN